MEVKPTDRMTLSLTRIKSNAGRKWAHTEDGDGWSLVIGSRYVSWKNMPSQQTHGNL